MPGLVPGIHALPTNLRSKDVDGRDKPGHDEHYLEIMRPSVIVLTTPSDFK